MILLINKFFLLITNFKKYALFDNSLLLLAGTTMCMYVYIYIYISKILKISLKKYK